MSIVVTGATGKLGGQTVDALLRRGVEPSEIVAAGRNGDRLAEVAGKGVRTATLDFDDPGSLAVALDGASRVLLVSVPGNPQRVQQHTNVVEAAEKAGVELLAYTSFVVAGKDPDHDDHARTEEVLGSSSVPGAVLRNGVYYAYFARQVPGWLEQGRVEGAAGDGLINAASHADLAEANAVVLTTDGHAGARYELGSDEPFTFGDLAAELGRQSGRELPYVRVSVEDVERRCVESGMTELQARRSANVDRGMAAGMYHITTGDLGRLLGRRPTTLAEFVTDALG